MKKQQYISFSFILGILFFVLSGCTQDSPKDLDTKSNTQVVKANALLSGDIVLNTHAKMAGVSRTLLPEGCPTKFYFNWNESKSKLIVNLPKFQVGNMPFAITFESNVTYSELNTWEKEEYPENGWIKFSTDDARVIPYVPEGTEIPKSDGNAIIIGYVNPNTQEIEFNINYNMMNVTSFTPRQKVDKSRLAHYEEDLKQFEKDLEEYKKKHGL